MAVITKCWDFEAAHQLIGHKGKCADLHGHSYRVEITVSGPIKPCSSPHGATTFGNTRYWDPSYSEPIKSDSGMVLDYDDLSRIMKPLIEQYLDHKFLNDLPGLPRSTAELIACWIYGAVFQHFGDSLTSVTISETGNTTAEVDKYDWVTSGRIGLSGTEYADSTTSSRPEIAPV